MTRHLGIVRISGDLLAQLIGLKPPDRILRLIPEDDHDVKTGTTRLLVESPALPAVMEGNSPMPVEILVEQIPGVGPRARIVP